MKCKPNAVDYLKLVYKQAHKFKYKGISFEDLVSIGNEAVCYAITKYDGTQGDFYPFVWNSVHYAICAEFKELRKSDKTRMPMTDIAYESHSMLDETGYNNIVEDSRNKILYKNLDQLSIRSKYIITARYLEETPKKLKDLAKELNISKQRVTQLEQDALKKLRSLLPCDIL